MKLSTITLLAGFLMAAQNIDAATINRDKVIKIINNSDREITFQAEYPDTASRIVNPKNGMPNLTVTDNLGKTPIIRVDRQPLAPNTSYNIKLVGKSGNSLSQIKVDMKFEKEKGSWKSEKTYSIVDLNNKNTITINKDDTYSLSLE
jgi:hypothetical protein